MKYYCYKHVRLDKNEVFYVGIAKKKSGFTTHKSEYRRAYQLSGRSSFWTKVYKKSKKQISIKIICEASTAKEIKKKEIEFVALYGRRNIGKGPLVNLTDGGDGLNGHVVTKKTRQLLRNINLGKKLTPEHREKIRVGNLGKKQSEEYKAKMRLKMSGKNNPMYGRTGEKCIHWGKPKSKEHKKKLSLNHADFRGDKSTSAKSVLQYSLGGEFIKEWSCIKTAAQQLKTYSSGISMCCKNKAKTSGGFKWKYKK